MPAVMMARTAGQTLDRDKNKGVREMPGCQIKAMEDRR